MNFILHAVSVSLDSFFSESQITIYASSSGRFATGTTSTDVLSALFKHFHDQYGVNLSTLTIDDHGVMLVSPMNYVQVLVSPDKLEMPNSMVSTLPELAPDLFHLCNVIYLSEISVDFWVRNIVPTLPKDMSSYVYIVALRPIMDLTEAKKTIQTSPFVDTASIDDKLTYLFFDVLKLPHVIKKETPQLQTLPIKL